MRFFLFYFVPIPWLLKTLFSPWKKDVTRYGQGFDLKRFLETLAFNLISRVLGAVVRAMTILFSLALEILVFMAGLAFFFLLFLWPFFLASSLVSGIYFLLQPGAAKLATLAIVVFDLTTISIFGLFYKKSQEKRPEQMTLAQILKQKWGSLVWERMGLDPRQIPETASQEPEKFLDGILKQISLQKEDFSSILEYQIMEESEKRRRKEFWTKENLFNRGGLGRSWLYGWTNTLDKYSSELTRFEASSRLIGRRQEIETMERVLCKSQQGNVLLVGEPGVGKVTLVKQFAKFIKEGKVASPLAFKRVLELDLNSALAGLLNEGQTRERLMRIFSEATVAGNIILVINDFHNFVFGDRDISPILIPFIEGSYFQLIALTTYENLHNQIERNSGLLKFFEKVEVKEPGPDQSLLILQESVGPLEKRIGRRVTYQALKEVIKTADQYISGTPLPEKALDLLEETALYVAANTPDYFVLPKHVDLVISQKTEIPIGELEQTEKEKLINLEEFIHQRIVDQEMAVQEIASAMRRARLQVAAKNRPMGSFLFLGPTGVGKTETAKALAQAYFGNETRMLRFDMSEYQGATAVERMLGSTLTQNPGILTTAVKENPFSLILLDEVEKADANILNLFLQIFDEGWLTDAFGHKINFRNTIIIATSNAAAELIRQAVEQGIDPSAVRGKILDYIQQNDIFKPEFLNRFDGIVIFQPLSSSDISKIAKLNLDNLAKRLKEQELLFNVTSPLVEKITQLGYEPAFGARAMKRVIQNKVEDLIAKKMLAGEIQKNVPFEIKAEEIN